MSIRSWLADRIRDFGDWFWENVVEPAVDWLREAINNIVVALRIFRHNLKAKLAKWLQNDAFFLLFIAAAVAAAVLIPKLLIKMQSWVVVIWVQSMAIKLKEATISIFDINAVIELVTIHKILLVLFDDYKETFYGFADAVSQMAAELGEGSAYLHAYFASLRSIMHGTNAILGGDPLQVEIEWYGRTSEFFREANDRFARYARDPGRLLYDFLEEVLIPAAEESRDVSQAQLDEIKNNHNRLTEIDDGQKELQLSLDTFIELQPNVLEEQFRERWDEINEIWTEINAVFFSEVMRRIDGVVEALEWRAEQQAAINEAARLNQEKAERRADLLLSMDEEGQQLMGDVYDHLISESNKEDVDDFQMIGAEFTSDMDRITAEYIRDLQPSPALGFEDSVGGSAVPDLIVDIPSPFVGDF